jgi:hypothetical protein
MKPRLFIGVPSYQESDSFRRTLESINRTTGVPYTLEGHVAKQSLVRNKNDLLRKARDSGAEYVCLCDDDVEPEPGWAEGLIGGIEQVHARSHRRVGQTSPLFVYPDRSVFCLWMNVLFRIDLGRLDAMSVGCHAPLSDSYRVTMEAGALPGTLTIFTREFLDRVNWTFDDRYEKSQVEDVDQSLTCRSEGFMLLYNGHCTVIHHAQGKTPRSTTDNHLKLVAKWGHRADLSLCIAPEPTAMLRAQALLTTAPDRFWDRLTQMVSLLGKHPLRRMYTAAKIVRRAGMSGLWNQCRGKMLERKFQPQ